MGVYWLCVWRLSVCIISGRVLAETLWISTSSCSYLRRLNCCWTMFVIPAKLPESFPLLQLFVAPTPQAPRAVLIPSSDSWLWKKLMSPKQPPSKGHRQSHSLLRVKQTQSQRPACARLLNVLQSARLTDAPRCSLTGNTSPSYVTLWFMLFRFYWGSDFRLLGYYIQAEV